VILWLSLTIFWRMPARSEEQPCRYEGDRVSCTKDGFKSLTEILIQHRSRADKCEVVLADERKNAEQEAAILASCQEIVAAIKPCPPKRSPVWPLAGIGAAVVGTVLLSAGFVANVPDSARLVIIGSGVSAIAGGVILAWP